jgi:4-aminobutyrate aminotransferase-like enzyme
VFDSQPRAVKKISTTYRKISTQIPAPGTTEVLEKLSSVESQSMHGQLPIVWNRASDFSVFDIAGNKFLDMTSTIFVTNVGHSNTAVADAISKALEQRLISTYAYSSEIKLNYLNRLLSFAGPGFEKAFLMSAGTEASEAVLKLIRMHGMAQNKGPGVVTIEGNWHGRTMGAQLLSSNSAQKEWVGLDDPNIHHIPFPHTDKVPESEGAKFFMDSLRILEERGIEPSQDISGFYLETFQGWGAHFYPKSYVQALASFASENKIILSFDEMQSGFGRTGKAFGFMHYDVVPDLIAVGKGMGNGVPISGVLGKGKILDLPSVGNMSSTHSGNPLVCAAGLAVLTELEERDLVEETRKKGEKFHQLLNSMAERNTELSKVTGKGLIAALIFADGIANGPGKFASAVAEKCMELGLLVVHTGRESIKLGPPLTIPLEALEEAVAVIEQAIQEVKSRGEL